MVSQDANQPSEGASPVAGPRNLENLKKRAKTLLQAYNAGEPEAVARVTRHCEARIDGGKPIMLAQAQFVIARENGFGSWQRLKAQADTTTASASPMRPFQTDLSYFEDRSRGLLSQLTSRLPEAAQQVRAQLDEAAEWDDAQIFDLPVTLDMARTVMAREHGYPSWRTFKEHIRQLESGEATGDFLEAFRAIESQDLSKLGGLLDANPLLVNAPGTNRNTLLNLAGACKFIPGVKLLLERGADPNIANVRGSTPMHQAGYSGHVEIGRLLIEAGARLDLSAHGDGGTPLMMALFWGKREMVDFLKQHGIFPANLRAAAGCGDLALLESLFDSQGELTPAARAHRAFYRPHSGFPEWAPADNRQEVLDEALVYAAKCGRVEAMQLLVSRGANINADPYRGTPLIWAVASRNTPEVIAAIAQMGAEVNLKGTFGGPTHGQGICAIHIAAQNGDLDLVKQLIALGADPAIRDDLHGGPAIGHARHFGNPHVADYLSSL